MGGAQKKGQWLLPGLWSFLWEEAVSWHPVASHFNFSLYATDALLAESQRVCVSSKSMQALLDESPDSLAVYFAAPTPIDFYSQKLWGFIFLALEPWAVQSGLGLGPLTPKVSLSIFIHHM